MGPLYIATERFDPSDGARWDGYIKWSQLEQLTEVVSLDSILCPTLLPDMRDDFWPHIVNEDFMCDYFTDLDFLRSQVASYPRKNLLCVFRNPELATVAQSGESEFKFIGYDLVDIHGGISALTNCGGFPKAFANGELSSQGLLKSFDRALEVQSALHREYSDEHHADCHVWAIFRND